MPHRVPTAARTLASLSAGLALALAACDSRPPTAPPEPAPSARMRAVAEADAAVRSAPRAEHVVFPPAKLAVVAAKLDALDALVDAQLVVEGGLTPDAVRPLHVQLDAVRLALGIPPRTLSDDVALQIPIVGAVVQALRAVLQFARTVIDLTTNLPNEVVDPIAFAVIDLISSILGLLG